MAQYSYTDYKVSDKYDLIIQNGDLVIADAPEALSYITIFRVLTDINEWSHSPGGVANLGRFFGSVNSSQTHRRIERDITKVLASKLEMNPPDLTVSASADSAEPSEVIIVISLNDIEYLDQAGVAHSGVGITLTFSYSMIDGKIVFIDDLVE